MSRKIPLTFRIAPDRLARLKAYAAQSGSQQTELIEKAIDRFLDEVQNSADAET